MGIVSFILIVLWCVTIFEGIYSVVKGYFNHEQNKVDKHEPNAYHKWVRITGVFIIICGAVNILWCVLDSLFENTGLKYAILVIITTAVMIVISAVSYCLIVKPADKKCGIDSEFSRILKEDKENK